MKLPHRTHIGSSDAGTGILTVLVVLQALLMSLSDVEAWVRYVLVRMGLGFH